MVWETGRRVVLTQGCDRGSRRRGSSGPDLTDGLWYLELGRVGSWVGITNGGPVFDGLTTPVAPERVVEDDGRPTARETPCLS
jgi:hypothetical protein